MKILFVTIAALPLLLGGCALIPGSAPEPVAAASSEAPSQARWEVGQAAYLMWSGQRRGWSTTPTGLQYRREGKAHPEGVQPGPTDTVKVHYEGTFIDGRVFDSSYERSEPAEFPLNRVIKGWTEGVALMRVGETYNFVIPADLAYGARWMGDEIPANSVLLFKVELLDVTPAA